MHQRRIIRDAFAVHIAGNMPVFGGDPENLAIVEGQPAVGDSRVFRSREMPARVETILAEGPMVNIYARRDTIKPGDYPTSGFDGGVKRTVEIAVEITATGAWCVDDKLDELADGIESLFEAFEVPGLPAAEIRLASSEIDSTDEFEQPLGGALLQYEVDYWRAYRTDTSPENKICEVFAHLPDGEHVQIGACAGVCEPGPVGG